MSSKWVLLDPEQFSNPVFKEKIRALDMAIRRIEESNLDEMTKAIKIKELIERMFFIPNEQFNIFRRQKQQMKKKKKE